MDSFCWEPLIVCVGLVCNDITVKVLSYPKPDTKIVTNNYKESIGGNGCNVAVALNKLGANVELITKILGGKGKVYDKLDRRGMFRNGLSIIKDDGHLGLSYIITDNKTRTILMTRMSEQFTADEIPLKPFNDFWSSHNVSCLYLDGRFNTVAEVYAREAVSRGVPIVMDIERSDRDGLMDLLEMCTGVIVSGYDTLNNIINNNSIFDMSSTLQWVIVTLGENGSVMETRYGEKLQVAARKINDIIDTTGAGDAYQAGLVYSICKRIINRQDNVHSPPPPPPSPPPSSSSFIPSLTDMQFASYLSSENCRHLGAQNTLNNNECRDAMIKANIL